MIMPINIEKLIKVYYKIESGSGSDFYQPLIKILEIIKKQSNLSDLFSHTSHTTLILTGYEKYEDRYMCPMIAIKSIGCDDRINIEYVEQWEEGDLLKSRTEGVICHIDESLSVLGEFVHRLRNITKIVK